MQEFIYFIFSVLFYGVLGYTHSAKNGDIQIKFGLIKEDEFYRCYVYSETTHIPLILKDNDPDFKFGYTLEYPDDRVFSSFFALSLPKPPKRISGSLAEAERRDNGRTLISAPELYAGETCGAFSFDEGDPIGKWKVDIYVNNALRRSIPFIVIPPAKIKYSA